MSDSLLKVAVRDHLGQAAPIASDVNGFLKTSTSKLTDAIYGSVVEPHEDGDLHAVFGLQAHYSCKVTLSSSNFDGDLEIDREGYIFVSDTTGVSKLTHDLQQIYRVVHPDLNVILGIAVTYSRVCALSGESGVNKIFVYRRDNGEFEREIIYDSGISGSSGGNTRFNKELVSDDAYLYHSAGAGTQCINPGDGSVVWGVNYNSAPEAVTSAASTSLMFIRDGLLYVFQAGGGWVVHDTTNGDIVRFGSISGTASGADLIGANILMGRTTGSFSEYLADTGEAVTRSTGYTAVHRMRNVQVTGDFIYCTDFDRIICLDKDFTIKWIISPVEAHPAGLPTPNIARMIVTNSGMIYAVRTDFTVLCLSAELHLKGYRI